MSLSLSQPFMNDTSDDCLTLYCSTPYISSVTECLKTNHHQLKYHSKRCFYAKVALVFELSHVDNFIRFLYTLFFTTQNISIGANIMLQKHLGLALRVSNMHMVGKLLLSSSQPWEHPRGPP